MKAGAALGLLAGLGALNAIRGGREGTGKRFTGLMDMLDGGGAGASGDRFEGGGLLSILGNLFAKPLEAQDNVERIAADTNATKAVTEVLKQAVTPEQRSSAAMAEMNRQRGLLADQFDPRDMQGATDFRPPAATKELTGSADMPPELLPMNTPRKALDTLFDRSVEQGYQGADMPSYVAEKRLIGMAEFPDSEYSDLDKINYASLMPPSVTRQAAEAPTAPYEKAPDSTSGLLSGNQAVPAMTNYNPTVPAMARSIAASDKVSPVFSQDYADYLEYLMTGRYPRG